MKESLITISIFIFYCILFNLFGSFLSLELKVTFIPFFSFITIVIIFVKKDKIRFSLNYQFIKIALIEFLIFLLMSILYSMLMANYFNQSIFSYYFSDIVLFSPFIIISYLVLVVLGYKEKKDLFYYGDKKKLALKMIVKIFFLTFIYGSVSICLTEILTLGVFDIGKIDYYFYLLGLTADVIIALFGYTFTSHWFDNDVQSVDGSIKGWLICIICYPPFLYLYKLLLSQVDNYIWSDWARGYWYYYPWLFFIIFTWLLYWVSHAHFGFKFSNLTWRGLINKGLYRYMRHPAYFFKNIYWWVYTTPFFCLGVLDGIHNIIVLALISIIYYTRAKTEEVHLMNFEEYRDYVVWTEKNSIWYRYKNSIFMFFKSFFNKGNT